MVPIPGFAVGLGPPAGVFDAVGNGVIDQMSHGIRRAAPRNQFGR